MINRHSTVASILGSSTRPRYANFQSESQRSELQLRQSLAVIQKTLDKYKIPSQMRARLADKLDSIHRQLDDRRLALAIIGESAGEKNNVLNQLLNVALLPTSKTNDSQAITTIRYGQQLHIKVALKGGDLIVWQHGNQRLAHTLGLLEPEPQTEAEKLAENRRLLNAIKTSDEIASYLQQVEITHESDFLARQVTVVEVPGLTFDRAEHEQVLFQMFEQQAGVALVVIPAKQGLSKRLIAHLHQSFYAYREHCVFVVTGIEQLPSEEQDALLAALEAQLKILLEISSPIIYACPNAQAAAYNSNELEGNPQLNRLQQGLLQQMGKSRLIRVEQQLAQISKRVVRILTTLLDFEVTDYEQRKTVLQHELIKDIKHFTTAQLQICGAYLQDGAAVAQESMFEAIEKLRQGALEELQQTIFIKRNLGELKGLEQDYSELTNLYGRRIQRLLLEASKDLVNAAVLGEMRVQRNFTAHYQRLQMLEPTIKIPTLASNTSLSLHNCDLQMVTQKYDSVDNNVNTKKVSFSNLVWSHRLFGKRAARRALQNVQQQYWQTLKAEMGQFFDQVEMHFMQLLNAYQRALMEQIEHDLEGYQAAYEQMCHELTKQQVTTQKRLQILGQQLYQDIQRIQTADPRQSESLDSAA
ncbi:dynamin family protein [filamentous cyanobacterium LEGE 11480]|uniref:Dynamin family protein n=1 Tax=Romeriopsis navalis LEGE 11480 TaxID=2777977 RepID=A0A928VMU4_9CYAN|nr:dynamin family protein [Romeriopsis navalis]MBE9031215.1 dynamin family protein [Romeriopsis navalis LEGE 11480]